MPVKTEKLSASLEDYLEAIWNLCAGQNVARCSDIADLLAVSRASVTGALKTLAKKNLVHYKPYGYITLTEKGKSLASKVARRHSIIEAFFTDILRLDHKIAQESACRAEHALGPKVVARLLRFVEFINEKNRSGPDIAERFALFCNDRSETGLGDKTLST